MSMVANEKMGRGLIITGSVLIIFVTLFLFLYDDGNITGYSVLDELISKLRRILGFDKWGLKSSDVSATPSGCYEATPFSYDCRGTCNNGKCGLRIDNTGRGFCACLICGDGLKDEGEECDDGNRYDCDFCSNLCSINICGNGRVDCNEECDDGNKINCDGCNSKCKIEKCGNSIVECNEECDDGNKNDGNKYDKDFCSNSCKRVGCCEKGIGECANTLRNSCTGTWLESKKCSTRGICATPFS